MPRIIISEPGKTPQPYRLKIDRIVTQIGRGNDNDILITTGSASTYHCKMKRVEGGFILADNNSTNGIKHEDTQYSIIDLKDGMTVQIGDDINLEFTLSDEEKETLSHEDFEPQQKASFPKSEATGKAKKETKPTSTADEDEDEDEDEVILETAKKKSSSSNDEEKPQSKLKTSSNKPVVASRPVSVKSNSGLNFIIFMIFAILFFVGGIAARHYQDHKTFIFSK